MAFIAEKLEKPVVERLDLTRHYITFDCDFPCYIVLNPSSANCLEGSDVVQVPIGAWQVDAWKFLVKDDFPNRAGFSAVFVYDEKKVNPPDIGRPETRYSDIDIAHMVSGLRGQPVNITQFTCTEAMPVQITTPDKEPLTVSTSGISYNPANTFGKQKDILSVSGLASELSATDKAVFSSFLSDLDDFVYDVDLARLSLNACFNKELLRLFPSGVGSLVTLSGAAPSPCIPFVPNRLLFEYGFDVEKKQELEMAVSGASSRLTDVKSKYEFAVEQHSSDFEALSAVQKEYSDIFAYVNSFDWEKFRSDLFDEAVSVQVDQFYSNKVVFKVPYSDSLDSWCEKFRAFPPYAVIFDESPDGKTCIFRFSSFNLSAMTDEQKGSLKQLVKDALLDTVVCPDDSVDAMTDYVSEHVQAQTALLDVQLNDANNRLTVAVNKEKASDAEVVSAANLVATREKELEEARTARDDFLSNVDNVILLRLILVYCYPYTAFKNNPTGASKVLCWKCGAGSQPVLSGSIQ